MKKYLKELVKQRKIALDYENWEDLFKKLKGNFEPGGKVRIKWKGYDYDDLGYVFTLPEMNIDENDFYLHIPKPDNPGGIGEAPEVHIHVLELASNDLVKSIKALTDV